MEFHGKTMEEVLPKLMASIPEFSLKAAQVFKHNRWVWGLDVHVPSASEIERTCTELVGEVATGWSVSTEDFYSVESGRILVMFFKAISAKGDVFGALLRLCAI